MNQLLIFDLDGTLIDSRNAILSSIRFALKASNLQYLEVDEDKAVQQDLASSLVQAAKRRGEVLSSEKIDFFIRTYREHHSHNPFESMRPYEGVIEALEMLKEKHQLAIATTKHSEQARHIVRELKLEKYFSHIQGTDPGMRYKPAPDILHHTARVLKRDSREGVYFGDSPHDMEAAIAAEMRAIGVTYGFAGKKALEPVNPSGWLHHPLDLLKGVDCKFL